MYVCSSSQMLYKLNLELFHYIITSHTYVKFFKQQKQLISCIKTNESHKNTNKLPNYSSQVNVHIMQYDIPANKNVV